VEIGRVRLLSIVGHIILEIQESQGRLLADRLGNVVTELEDLSGCDVERIQGGLRG
jgi:hypothetical protein